MFGKMKDIFTGSASSSMSGAVEYILVGLGNPGREYENTRHNAGFLFIDSLAAKKNVKVDRLKFKSLCGETMIAGKKVLLIKPSTFMNLSGEAVREAMQFYKLPPEKVLVVFDDISLPPGKLRIRLKGSDGGHNGIKNIIYLSGKDTFPRVKIGVGGKPHPDYDLARWVLSRFTPEEQKTMEQDVFTHSEEIASLFIEDQLDKAMNLFNR